MPSTLPHGPDVLVCEHTMHCVVVDTTVLRFSMGVGKLDISKVGVGTLSLWLSIMMMVIECYRQNLHYLSYLCFYSFFLFSQGKSA